MIAAFMRDYKSVGCCVSIINKIFGLCGMYYICIISDPLHTESCISVAKHVSLQPLQIEVSLHFTFAQTTVVLRNSNLRFPSQALDLNVKLSKILY